MKPRCLLPCLLAFAALAFSGCETSGLSARIQEKSAAYATFSDELKARVGQGDVSLGDSADAVYIALGKPSSIGTRPSEKGEIQVWTYTKFVIGQELATKVQYAQPGQRFVGTPMSGSGGRLGGGSSGMSTAPSRGNMQASIEAGELETVTLHVDILDNKVAALRVDK